MGVDIGRRGTSRDLPLKPMRSPQVDIPLDQDTDAGSPNVTHDTDKRAGHPAGRGGLRAGAKLDVGDRELFGVTMDFLTRKELHDELEAFGSMFNQREREIPTQQEIHMSGTASAAGAVTIDMGAPSASKVWDVRRLAVTGADPTVTVACAVRIYRVLASSPLHLVDVGTQTPSVATYSRGQFNLKPTEHFYVVVTGFTASAQVSAVASAEETTWQRREEYAL